MNDTATKTASEIEAAGESLFEWVLETGRVLAVAAVLAEDTQSGGVATRPEALIAGALGLSHESELAVLLVQIEGAALALISKLAPDTDMGEEAFMDLVRTARKVMLDAEGLDLCGECGG